MCVNDFNSLLGSIVVEPTVDDFVGVWTYNLTVNITADGAQKDLEIYIECSKRSEKYLQCIGAGDTESGPTHYNILSDGTIEFVEDPLFRGILLEDGVLIWYENGTMMDHKWKKQGISLKFA